MMVDYSNAFLKVRDSIDIYVADKDNELVCVQFYFINTRRKISIEIDSRFCGVLAAMDGRRCLSEILCENKLIYNDEAGEIIQYLLDSKVIKNEVGDSVEDCGERYSRQINFFDDWIESLDGQLAQQKIFDAECVVFGVGAVGANIAIHLVRAGVGRLVLVDYKKVSESSRERHSFFSKDMVGEYKVDALKRYLNSINEACEITAINQRVLPSTDLKGIIPESAGFVINTADEPYIGHISIKLGRYLWEKGIPMYVAGGFDAHLMSTGDFFVPGESVCVDCCSGYFTSALKNWKPSYKVHESQVQKSRVIGGAGGVQPMSSFSASYASMLILNYLAGGAAYRNIINKRGEFSQSGAKITWVDIKGREGCDVCA